MAAAGPANPPIEGHESEDSWDGFGDDPEPDEASDPDDDVNELPGDLADPRAPPLPPERRFESLDELVRFANARAAPYGYAFAKQRTKRIGEKLKVFLSCTHAGVYREDVRPRQGIPRPSSISTKTNCLFGVLAWQQPDGVFLAHRNGEQHARHNHDLALAGAYHQHRKLSAVEVSKASAMFLAGAQNRQIVAVLRKTRADAGNTISILPQDIRNLRRNVRIRQANGETPPGSF